jgi:hypothetical protein
MAGTTTIIGNTGPSNNEKRDDDRLQCQPRQDRPRRHTDRLKDREVAQPFERGQVHHRPDDQHRHERHHRGDDRDRARGDVLWAQQVVDPGRPANELVAGRDLLGAPRDRD